MSFIPRDKIVHAAGGVIVAGFAAVFSAIFVSLAWHPIAIAIFVGGWCVGISIEGTQYYDNKRGIAVHEISFWDAFATATPGMLAALAFQYLVPLIR